MKRLSIVTALASVEAVHCEEGACVIDDCLDGFDNCDLDPSTGCEFDFNSPATCGSDCETGVNCALLPDVGETTCTDGTCEILSCQPGHDHCDSIASNGCEVDLEALTTCGTDCDDLEACSYPNAEALCVAGDCEMGECNLHYHNLDPDDPGCEYGPCVYVGEDDIPNRVVHADGSIEFVDSNCDGIDGDIYNAIFVSATTGSDSSWSCSINAPCASIERGIAFAKLWSLSQILVADGTYQSENFSGTNIPLELPDGIGIYGGYDVNWVRADRSDSDHQARIYGGFHSSDSQYMAVRADGVTSTVANLVIVAPNASGRVSDRGRSSYGVHARNSALTFNYVTVVQGNGYSGAGGSSGTSASTTEDIDGDPGDPGFEDVIACGINNGGDGGAGGTNSQCSGNTTRGGAGGDGGAMDSYCWAGACDDWFGNDGCDSTDGSPGSNAGTTSTGHGHGGDEGVRSEDHPHSSANHGDDGEDGENGDDGSGGFGGPVGGFILNNYWWAGRSGGNGYVGDHGTGGGGGGGGGGCDDGWDESGGGGGGGGAGGCRAPTAGSLGRGGGGSFGIFGVNSTLNVTHCEFQRGVGGAGGDGGTGGSGQDGGSGGSKGTGPGPDGGDGGPGGDGGDSGGGGGGGGGISFGIYIFGGSVTGSGNTSSGGSGGAAGDGGWSPGNDGIDGAPGTTGLSGSCALSVACGDPD